VRTPGGSAPLCPHRPGRGLGGRIVEARRDPVWMATTTFLTTAALQEGYLAHVYEASASTRVFLEGTLLKALDDPPPARLHRAPLAPSRCRFQPCATSSAACPPPCAIPVSLGRTGGGGEGGGGGGPGFFGVTSASMRRCWRPLAPGVLLRPCPSSHSWPQPSGSGHDLAAGQAPCWAPRRANGAAAAAFMCRARNPQMMQARCLWRTTAT